MTAGHTVKRIDIGELQLTINLMSLNKGERWSATCEEFRRLITYGNTQQEAKDRLVYLIYSALQRDTEAHWKL